MQRNCSMQTSDKRKLSGMTPNVGDFDQDGFVDIYVTEWLPHTLGKVYFHFLLFNYYKLLTPKNRPFRDIKILSWLRGFGE